MGNHGIVCKMTDKSRKSLAPAIITDEEWDAFMKRNNAAVINKRPESWRSKSTGEKVLSLLDVHHEIICLDTETTGTKHDSQIIQFSAIRLRLPEMTEVNRLDVYIRPEAPLEEIIVNITGITDEFLADEKSEQEVFPIIREFLGYRPFFCAFNTRFDLARIQDLYARQGENFEYDDYLDAMEMAKDQINPEDLKVHDGGKLDDGKPHYKQEVVAKFLHADEDLQFHSAIFDTVCVTRLLKIFTDEYRKAKESADIIKQIPRLVPNGCYYWQNPKMPSMQRVRVFTNLGELYIDVRTKIWMEPKKKECRGLINYIDMESLQKQCFREWHVDSIDDLIKVTRNRWKERQIKPITDADEKVS